MLRESIAQRTADGIVLIEEALYSYRLHERPTYVDPTFPYEWPDSLSALDPYLPGIAVGRNGLVESYDIIPSASAGNAYHGRSRSKQFMLTAQRA